MVLDDDTVDEEKQTILGSIEIKDGASDNHVQVVSADSAPTYGLTALVGQYNATPITLTDTHLTFLQTNASGQLIVAGAGTDSDTAITTLTWTEQVIADWVAPDTDTAIDVTGAKSIYIQFDSTGATTGTPDFDVHVISSGDGTTYTTVSYTTPFSAQAINVVDGAVVTPGPKSIKLRLDVNTANLAAGESVVAKVFVVF